MPERLVRDNAAWLPNMVGFTPPGGVYTHVVGIDLVRTGPNDFFVLEDNARTPSGVSYMLENRETMMGMFPELFSRVAVETVSDYPMRLARSLAACAPRGTSGKPVVAVCHAPGVLRHTRDPYGLPLVQGKAVTGFTNTEEAAVGLTKVVPFLVEDMLKGHGGVYEKGADWAAHVVTDHNLITEQNPASSKAARTRVQPRAQRGGQVVGIEAANHAQHHRRTRRRHGTTRSGGHPPSSLRLLRRDR